MRTVSPPSSMQKAASCSTALCQRHGSSWLMCLRQSVVGQGAREQPRALRPIRGNRVSFEMLLQSGGGCWEPPPYKLLLQSFALVRYCALRVSWTRSSQSSERCPKSVLAVSKGIAKMLQVSIWNDLPVGETSS